MTKKIILGNHMVPEIVAHLRKIAPIPATGILAGQALASAILDLYGGGGGVYNDIDVFVPAVNEKLAELTSAKHLQEEAMRLGLPVAQLDDYRMLVLSDGRDVQIAGTEEDGLINYVWCDTTKGDLLPGALVYSFDLNAVEVALDLQFNELTWTPAFEHFINNRELEVTSLITPERTLLRYLKKRAEMPTLFGQDDLVKRMVATWLASDYAGQQSAALTTKSLAMAREFAPCLKGIFELSESGNTSHLQVCDDWPMATDLEEAFGKFVGQFAEASGLTRLLPSYWYTSRRGQAAGAAEFAADILEFFEERTENEGGWENAMHLNAAFMGAAYTSGVRSRKHRETILRVLEKHDNLTGALQGLTLNQQYECVLDLAKRAKSRAGQLVYGYVETVATPVDMWNQHHRDQFFRQLTRELPGVTLCTPVFPTFEKDGWVIRELYTASSLRKEGMDMHHCVGGYAFKVKMGTTRILSIRHKERGKWASTVEITGKVAVGENVTVAQHRSYNNSPVADETKAILKTYLAEQSKALGFTMEKRSSWAWDGLLAA